jgi:hypothetical protein
MREAMLKVTFKNQKWLRPGAAVLVALAAACGGGDDDGGGPSETAPYLISTAVTNAETTSTFFTLFDSLEDPEDIDLGYAVEVPGWADARPFGQYVFVSDAETPTVTRFRIDGADLVEDGRISFANYGDSAAMYSNHFVSATKSYMAIEKVGFVVWDPTAMTIVKMIPAPQVDLVRDGLDVSWGIDRGEGFVHGNRLYQPFGWFDYTNFKMDPRSGIAIYDVETDELVTTLDVDCPDLTVVSGTDDGDVYFSDWGYAPGARLIGGATPCAVRILAGTDAIDPTWKLTFSEITGGHDGAGLHVLDGTRGVVNVFHSDHAPWDMANEPLGNHVFGANWQLWTVDVATRAAQPVSGIDWNGGGHYVYGFEGRTFVLLPDGDYAGSSVYEVGADGTGTRLRGVAGWSTRLFRVR